MANFFWVHSAEVHFKQALQENIQQHHLHLTVQAVAADDQSHLLFSLYTQRVTSMMAYHQPDPCCHGSCQSWIRPSNLLLHNCGCTTAPLCHTYHLTCSCISTYPALLLVAAISDLLSQLLGVLESAGEDTRLPASHMQVIGVMNREWPQQQGSRQTHSSLQLPLGSHQPVVMATLALH